jgi:hypothetical protein
MTEDEEDDEVQVLKAQVRFLKDALVAMAEEREARRAPNMLAFPWGVRVATRLTKKAAAEFEAKWEADRASREKAR